MDGGTVWGRQGAQGSNLHIRTPDLTFRIAAVSSLPLFQFTLEYSDVSNHSGSYMLSSMLLKLARESYFSKIGPEKTSEFLEDIIGLAQMYDSNPGEVFRDVSETLGICSSCFKQSDDLKDGSCPSCR